MSSSSSDARLRTRNESRETRVDRIVIKHPDGIGGGAGKSSISRQFTVLSRDNRSLVSIEKGGTLHLDL
jgi:hypothetical protein